MRTLLVAAALLLPACPPPILCDAGMCTADGGDGGQTSRDAGPPFTVIELDATAVDAVDLAMAIDRATDRVGVAYFTNLGTQTNPGVPDYALKYVEWRQGVATTPQTVRTVQRVIGLSLAFDPATSEPVVAYLGGGSDTSLFWLQSDAVLNKRSGGMTWTETAVSTRGDQITCGNNVSDLGFVVGLWPTFTWDSTGKLYFVSRDVHQGQNPVGDWQGSDVELWEGAYPPTTGTCLSAKAGGGGHNQLVMGAADQPALIYDTMDRAADTGGVNVTFQRRTAAGTWTAPLNVDNANNTQNGGALAWDPTEGYGVAVMDRANSELRYVRSADGTAWDTADIVFSAGSGGWYPSLAMDPVFHEPAIAFVSCSPQDNVNEGSCPAASDELRVVQRSGTRWNATVVDTDGAAHPKLGFFNSGKRVIAYRSPPTLTQPVQGVGKVKLAVER